MATLGIVGGLGPACADEAQRRSLRRLGLLGTRFTMEGSFYPTVFARRGIAIVSPNDEERAWVHDRYIGQLLKGQFLDETREGVISVVRRLRTEEKIDGAARGYLTTCAFFSSVPPAPSDGRSPRHWAIVTK